MVWQCVRHGEDLSSLCSGAGPSAATESTRLAAGESPSIFRRRPDRSTRSEDDRRTDEREERGYPPYHPRMTSKLLVYGYYVGVFSSRKLGKRLTEDVASRVLAAGNVPDFRSLTEFRRIHLEALEGLFEQVLRLALEMRAMQLRRVAIDGTKVKANASNTRRSATGGCKRSNNGCWTSCRTKS